MTPVDTSHAHVLLEAHATLESITPCVCQLLLLLIYVSHSNSENVDPGFTIEARVFCYTYTDPEKLDAQRRITTPQKALERLTQVARNTAKNTPQTLRRLKRRIISRIHGRSRSSSRGPSTPDRVVPAARIEKDFILVCPKSCLFWRLLFYKSRATCSFLGLTGCL
eukprot:m.168340 g.168340  ORF g.168340 m.168340 type:complete len:166 (-) comp16467_c0_seq5:1468-1965(-)